MSRELQLRQAREDASVPLWKRASAQDSQRLRLAFCIALYALLCIFWFPLRSDSRPTVLPRTRPNSAPPRKVLVPPAAMPISKPPTRTLKTRAAISAEPIAMEIGPNIEPLTIASEQRFLDDEEWPIELPEAPSPTDEVLVAGTPGVVEPVFTRRVQPEYPKQGESMRLQGYVILQAILRRDGTVDAIEVLRGLGKGKFGFEREAISSLRKWRFIPGSYNGEPADVRMNLRVDFVLN